jgi:hypothetical protein
MENESPLPEAPLSPRIIPFKKAMAYGWAGILIGAIFLVDGIIMAAVFQLAMPGDLPSWVTIGLPILMGVPGLFLLLLALGRISKRRHILESGRAVPGKILSCEPKKGWNPPPWVVTFEAEDPMSGQPVQGKRWFLASTWTSRSSRAPRAGENCLVVVDEGMGQRIELLALGDWCAWSD